MRRADAHTPQQAAAGWRTSAPVYAAVLGPILVLVLFAGVLVHQAWREWRAEASVAAMVESSRMASALAHELQKERGMSAGFVASGGRAFASELLRQRRATDKMLNETRAVVLAAPDVSASGTARARAAARVETLRTRLDDLAQARGRIDAVAMAPSDVAAAYTPIIMALLSAADDGMWSGAGAESLRAQSVYRAVLEAKEYAGRERAAGAVGFGSGAFEMATYLRFAGLSERQAVMFKRVQAIGAPEEVSALERALRGPEARRVEELRALAGRSVTGGAGLDGVDGPAWFAASTAYLGALHRVAHGLEDRLVKAAGARAASARTLLIAEVGVALAAVVFALLFGVRIVRSMIKGMRGVVSSIAAIERREDGVEVPGQARRDEIGVIARSLTAISDQGAAMARVQAAVDGSSTALLIVEPDGALNYANAAFEMLWGEVRPAFGDLERAGADGRRGFRPLLEAVSAAELDDRWAKKPDGVSVLEIARDAAILEVSRQEVRDGAGKLLGYCVELVNVTDIRALENEVKALIMAVKAGRFDYRVGSIDNMGFTSVVATGLNDLMDRISDFMAEIGSVLSAMADGDLTQRMRLDAEGDFARVQSDLNANVSRFAETLGEIADMIARVRAAAQPIADGAGALAGRADAQSGALRRTSETVTAMADAIHTSVENAGAARDLSQRASERSASGGEVVQAAVGAMDRIAHSSDRIADIISVIDGIAFQTNLLALNAAVEAARAGDAGKGFAVVASEVRALAQRSADAAKDIKSLISESAGHVSEGVRLVNETGSALTQIAEAIGHVRDTVSEIAAAGGEQTSRSAEITGAIAEMNQMTAQNSGLAEESAASAARLAEDSERLAGRIGAFRVTERGTAAPSAVA